MDDISLLLNDMYRVIRSMTDVDLKCWDMMWMIALIPSSTVGTHTVPCRLASSWRYERERLRSLISSGDSVSGPTRALSGTREITRTTERGMEQQRSDHARDRRLSISYIQAWSSQRMRCYHAVHYTCTPWLPRSMPELCTQRKHISVRGRMM